MKCNPIRYLDRILGRADMYFYRWLFPSPRSQSVGTWCEFGKWHAFEIIAMRQLDTQSRGPYKLPCPTYGNVWMPPNRSCNRFFVFAARISFVSFFLCLCWLLTEYWITNSKCAAFSQNANFMTLCNCAPHSEHFVIHSFLNGKWKLLKCRHLL